MFFFNKKVPSFRFVKKQAVAKITDFNLLEFLKLLHFLLEKLVKNNLQGLSHSFLSADNHWAQKTSIILLIHQESCCLLSRSSVLSAVYLGNTELKNPNWCGGVGPCYTRVQICHDFFHYSLTLLFLYTFPSYPKFSFTWLTISSFSANVRFSLNVLSHFKV